MAQRIWIDKKGQGARGRYREHRSNASATLWYAVRYVLGSRQYVLPVRATSRDDAFYEARDMLRRVFVGAAIQGSPQVMSANDEQWYVVDDDPASLSSLGQLVDANDPGTFGEVDIVHLSALPIGESYEMGGGASATQVITRVPPPGHRANAGYYVWLMGSGNQPLSEGPYGPHPLDVAKKLARIGATEGIHDRAVSRGRDPRDAHFEIVRRYRAGTGKRVI